MEFAISATALLAAAKALETHAAGSSNTEMSRVVVKVEDHSVLLRATDGYRLASIPVSTRAVGSIGGSFERVIEQNLAVPPIAKLSLDYKATVAALKSLKGEKRHGTNGIKITFPEGMASFEEITLKGEGGISATLLANVVAPEGGSVVLNRQYLLDAIVSAGAKDDGTVALLIRKPLEAVTVEGENGNGSVFLVMPVRE